MFCIYIMKLLINFYSRLKLLKNIFKMSANDIPLVVIIGATGCAKTKLSLQIAKQFNGEIISADSMQVYKGIDIITNKATPEERHLIPHHLIDFLDPLNRFTVIDFRNKALKVINELIGRRKVPILVGGTNYYIESILWEVLIQNKEQINDKTLVFDGEQQNNYHLKSDEELTKENIFLMPIYSDSFQFISNFRLHSILKQLDPISADGYHPNERRKVIRSLQIYQQNNRPKSQLIEEQKCLDGGSQYGGPLRFKNSVILWVDCDTNVLNKRLDERVDQMIEKGLIDELLNFHYNYNKQRIAQNLSADYSKGIFQSIGFKEFHNYLLLTEEQRNNEITKGILNQGINCLKLVTKRYAKHQIKWIRNRFLKLNDREVPHIYRLNTTSPEMWTQHVLEPSIAIVSAYINQSPVPINIKPELKIEINENISKVFRCDVCNKRISGLIAFEKHLHSKRHKYQINDKNNSQKQKYYQLLAILKSHENNLKVERRKSI